MIAAMLAAFFVTKELASTDVATVFASSFDAAALIQR